MKDRCNVRTTSSPQNSKAQSNTRDQIYANAFLSLKPTPYEQKSEEELCPSDYSGLSSHPFDCKKFVNCWKGKMSERNDESLFRLRNYIVKPKNME